jgi:hypothetical protein
VLDLGHFFASPYSFFFLVLGLCHFLTKQPDVLQDRETPEENWFAIIGKLFYSIHTI